MLKRIHQSYFVIAFCVGVLMGTILILIFRWNFFASFWWVVLVILLFIYSYIYPSCIFIIISFTSGMIAAFCRATPDLIAIKNMEKFYGQNISITGKVNDDPKQEDEQISFVLAKLEINGEPIKGKIYVSTKNDCNLEREDYVSIDGTLLDGFGSYSGSMRYVTIKNITHSNPTNITLDARNWLSDRIKQTIEEPESLLGISYLLGIKNGLPTEISDALRVVGLTHVVVASGTHLSILVDIVRKIFKKVSRFAELFFSILFVLFFMIMVGWTASILRAGIMTFLMLLAWYTGRKFEPWRILIITMSITLLINPMFVIDLGWLLSFASLIGVMIVSPLLVKFFYGRDKIGFISSTITTTVSATIITLPIVLYYYGSFSLISIFANLLILPTLPYAMCLTFCSGLLVKCEFFRFLTSRLLSFHLKVIDFCNKQEFFIIKIQAYNVWVFLLYVPIIIMLVIGHHKRKVVKLGKYNIR